jgi:glutamate formiminotransferase/formiminotetrahydrofolate cyclodeaminase
VSLLLMVAGMAKTRSGAAEETADLAGAAARLRPLRDALLDLVDRDSDAYGQVVAAMKLPRMSGEEKTARRAAIDAATRTAIDAPLDTMRASQQALGGAVVVALNGNRNAASDVGVAIGLLEAALRGARLNVEINVNGVDDAAYVAGLRTECEELERNAAADANRAREALR